MDEKLSDKNVLSRREFLKLSAATAAAFLTGCVDNKTSGFLTTLTREVNKTETKETPETTELTPEIDLKTPTPEKNPDNLKQLVLETRVNYPYQSFLYPVSDNRRLPDSFSENKCESELIKIDRLSTERSESENTDQYVEVAEELLEPLKNLFSDALKDGQEPYLRSAFRSISTQRSLFERNVNSLMTSEGLSRETAEEFVNRSSAKPGFSEHHTGWAVDILDKKLGSYLPGNNQAWNLARDNYDKGMYSWLMQNSHKYGFVISYPVGNNADNAKENSGYKASEPWHLRFIGVPMAYHMKDKDYLNPETSITLNTLLLECETIG